MRPGVISLLALTVLVTSTSLAVARTSVLAAAGPARPADSARLPAALPAPMPDRIPPERPKPLAIEPTAAPQDLTIGEPDFDLGPYTQGQLDLAARSAGVQLGVHLDREPVEELVTEARLRLAPPLTVAGVRSGPAVRPKDVRAAADRLDLPLGPDLATEDLDRLAATGRELLRPVLLLLGVDPGDRVDAGDLEAGARSVGLAGPVDTAVLERMVAAARWRLAPVLWTAGVDVGGRIDLSDLEGAVRAVGHDPGGRIDPADADQAIATARAGLQQVDARLVSPGLELVRFRARLQGGSSIVHVLRWRLDDPRVAVRTEPATVLGGRASVVDVARSRAPAGAVAAVNGGFWVGRGDPDGLLVTDGEVLSDATRGTSWTRGRRTGFGVLEGAGVVGRPDAGLHVLAPGAGPLPVRGVNRQLSVDDRDLVVYTPAWGPTTRTPPGTFEVPLAGVRLTPALQVSRPAGAPSARGDHPIPRDGIVLAARGRAAGTLQAAAEAGALTLEVTAPHPWDRVSQALSAGPVLLVRGAVTGPDDWHFEGFGTAHTMRRHPRTAVGVTRERVGLLVVVDGRQPGWSDGMTTIETALLLRTLGAADAVMLDGGGSSQLAVGGKTANRPCCDPGSRPVATTVVFYARP